MKILYDYQIFLLQNYGGISRYFSRLATELAANGEDTRIVAPIHRNQYLQEMKRSNVVGVKMLGLPSRFNSVVQLLNRYASKQYLKDFSPSIIHETYYESDHLPSKDAKRILTVYDMIHERFANSESNEDETTRNKYKAVSRADHIIAISESTKKDLCKYFKVPNEKITVVHLGFERFGNTEFAEGVDTHDRPYLLYVGNRSGYKNFEGMLRAIASDAELRETFDVIAFGGPALSSCELTVCQKLGLRPNSIRHVSGDDKLLGTLYKNASAFVYPSCYEGFGLPPLEAMAQGCPVVVSNTSSIPEVVGNAGEYFDPHDCEHQANAIRRVVLDSQRRDDLIAKGYDRLNHFSWKRCAQETYDVYTRVLNA